jgi:hypothetical protein
MSKYTISQLHEGTRISGRPAWHYSQADLAQLEAKGFYFPNGPVPQDVAMDLVGWQPVAFTLPCVVDPTTMEAYAMPDHLSKVIARPGKGVINVTGDGYNENLHNVMRENLEVAVSGGYTIEAAVCLGDGDFLGVTLIPSDDVTLAGQPGSLRTRLAMVSSLTGKIATGLVQTTTRGECDNTIQMQLAGAARSLMVKRTRNSSAKVSVGAIREAFEIGFAETAALAAELERLGNIAISDDDMRKVLDLWMPLTREDGTDKEGASLTKSMDTRGSLVNLFASDPRKIDGKNAASLLNAHNTWQHWTQVSKGAQDRFARQMERTATGNVGKLDADFMALVAQVKPEVQRVLTNA